MKVDKLIRPDLDTNFNFPPIKEIENSAVSIEGKVLEKWLKNN